MKTSPANFVILYGHKFFMMTLGRIAIERRHAEFESNLNFLKATSLHDGTWLSEQIALAEEAWNEFKAMNYEIVPHFRMQPKEEQTPFDLASGDAK